MPNWCENSLCVVGNFESLNNLFESAKESGLLESIIPLGEWDYDKAVSSWGTKWDVDFLESSWLDKDAEGDGGTLYLNFDSAWGPPINVFKKLAETYQVEGYFISGMDFCGQFENESADQELKIDEWEDFQDLPKEEIEKMGTDLKFMVEQEIEFHESFNTEPEKKKDS